MQRTEAKLEAFEVIGITTRTSNAEEFTGAGKLGKTWQRFMSENLAAQIPGRIDQNILAVYFEYERDATAPYTFLLGVRVANGTNAPEGFRKISIPAQSYTKFTTDKGQSPQVVIDAWSKIWDLEDESKIDRLYTFDYEEYDHRAADPKATVIDVFISTR